MEKPLFKDVCDEHIYSRIHREHAKNLHNFIYYKFGAHFNPKDKVQEAFIKLWKNCKKIPPEKAKSFLYTVINNLSLNDAKHKKIVLKFAEIPQKTHTNESPQFILEEQEYHKKYLKVLAKLPEGQREVFLMNRIEGKKLQEIADQLSLSKKAIEKRLYTALRTLRKEIEGI